MTPLVAILFWVSTGALGWVYLGYPLVVSWFSRVRRMDWSAREPAPVSLVVVIACHNEGARIGRRLEQLERISWPGGIPSAIVVADRCTDATAGLARKFGWVRVIEVSSGPGGRARAHNVALAATNAQVAIFSDADTEFDRNFLVEIMRPFADPDVGCVVGRLSYRSDASEIAAAERSYFEREVSLRLNEARCGILATGTGACMAVRTALYRPLLPAHDVDFVTPLDVVLTGHRVVMAPNAIAFDTPPDSIAGEWRVRFRQTSRNVSGTVGRWWSLRGWRYPLVTAGLLSHKVLRWATGWLLVASIVTGFLLWEDGVVYRSVALAAAIGLTVGGLVAVLGALGVRLGRLALLGAFVTASAAMSVGCVAAVFGRARPTYTPMGGAR